MRAFEDIPNEILLQIASDVHSSDQLSLSLTSQRLHSIAESHLYRSVTLADLVRGEKSERKLQRFLRTIISRPELGAITRHLNILWYEDYDGGLAFGPKKYEDRGYLATMQTLAREKGLSALAVSELENGWCPPHFSLLMHLLPSLESLLLRGMDMETRWIRAQSEYYGPTPGLRSLSVLQMSSLRAEDVILFMAQPTLNSFRAGFFWGRGKIRWDEDNNGPSGDPGGGFPEGKQGIFRTIRFVKRSSKLKNLEFHSSAVDSELFDVILQIPEALETLIYGDDRSHDHIDLPAMARALRYQINSLTTLSPLATWLTTSNPWVPSVTLHC